MNLKSLWLSLLIVVFTTGCASKKYVNTHPDYVNLSKEIERVVILPLDAEMERLVFTGENEELSDEVAANAGAIQEIIEMGTQNKNYEVVTLNGVDLNTIEGDIAFHVSQIKDSYSSKKSSMFERLNPHLNTDELESVPVQADSVTIQSLNHVAAALDVDAFLIARYYGFRKSAGLISKDLASSVLVGLLTGAIVSEPTSGHSLEVGMIEAATGKVLWTNVESKPQIVIEELKPVMESLPHASRIQNTVETDFEESTEETKELSEAI